MKIIVALLLLASCVFAQDANWMGYKDTSRINTFRADSLKYSKTFPLSAFENVRIDVFANDTSAAGFKSDSIKFVWGIQTGHWAYTTSNTDKPVWVWAPQVVIDTFNTVDTLKMVLARKVMDSYGTIESQIGYVDTLNFSGFAYQTRNFAPEWDQSFRVWFRGVTGNKKASFVALITQVSRRKSVNIAFE
jgi:hypothetical protein